MFKSKNILVLVLAIGLVVGVFNLDFMYNDVYANEDYIIKLSHEVPVGSPQDICARRFKEIVEKRSNGRVRIDIFIANQLGDPVSVLESVQLGGIEMCCENAGSTAQILKELTVVNLPAMFSSNVIEVHEVFNSDAMKNLLENIGKEMNIKCLVAFPEPYNQLTANRPIKKPEDLKGIKIRVMNSPILIATYKALGASPTPLPFSEVYSSLQLGMVEAQENPYDIIYDMSFYEVQKYLISSKHSITADFLWINNDFFKNLPEDIQKIFIEAGKETQNYLFEVVPKLGEEMRQKLLDKGMIECIPGPELSKAFKEASIKAREEYIKIVGEEKGERALELIDEAVAKAAAE